MSATSPTQLFYDVFISETGLPGRRRAHSGRGPAGMVAAVVDADPGGAGHLLGGPALTGHGDSSLRLQPGEIAMPSTPPDIGQPTREARTGREDRGHRGNKWWTLVAVCLGTFMLLLDITIVNVALPDIPRALHSSFSDLQWVVDAYALTLAAFLLTAGSLADMYGRRLLYLIGLVVFTGASALCGFATSTLMLQLSRGLQGAGGGVMVAVCLAPLA